MKPVAPNLNAIPDALKSRPNWVCWSLVERDGKPTKVPHQPNGNAASSTDSRTWTTFPDVALATSRFDGIGYVFTANDGHVGIDLDRCRDPQTGETEPWALGIINEINSYTELSQSGKGYHIIVRGKLPVPGNRRGRVEMYGEKRFFVMTGDVQDGRDSIREYDLSNLHRRLIADQLDPLSKPKLEGAVGNDPRDESALDYHLIGDIHGALKTSSADEIEAEFRKRHQERYDLRNLKKGMRGNKNYIRYSIEHFR